MNSSYGSLDWVLSHLVHITVFMFVYFVFVFSYCIIVSTVGGPGGIELA